jgi:hypothetical protein
MGAERIRNDYLSVPSDPALPQGLRGLAKQRSYEPVVRMVQENKELS